MTPFNLAFTKNFAKSTLMAVTIVSSTLGLRTELAIITGDIGAATWIAILWVFVLIAIISYYKSKIDVELATLQGHERNRAMLGVLRQELAVPVPPVRTESPKIGDPVFFQEDK